MKVKDKQNREILEEHDLRADTLQTITKEVDTETKKVKSAEIPVTSLFGGAEYVKIKKSD